MLGVIRTSSQPRGFVKGGRQHSSPEKNSRGDPSAHKLSITYAVVLAHFSLNKVRWLSTNALYLNITQYSIHNPATKNNFRSPCKKLCSSRIVCKKLALQAYFSLAFISTVKLEMLFPTLEEKVNVMVITHSAPLHPCWVCDLYQILPESSHGMLAFRTLQGFSGIPMFSLLCLPLTPIIILCLRIPQSYRS